MDSLLSVSFNNLSSDSTDRIRKGLKQIDGLLAQICLITTPPPASTKTIKSLHDLSQDLAFVEFFRLQERFEWNLSSQLTETLDRLLSSAEPDPVLIHQTLDTLTALMLLHPPSRLLFARRPALFSILDLLEPSFSASFGDHGDVILVDALTTLMVAMLETPRVARAFEREGLELVVNLTRSSGPGSTKAKELLDVWMLPELSERPVPTSSHASLMSSRTNTTRRLNVARSDALSPQKTRHTSQASEDSSILSGISSESLRTSEEKAKMLKRALGTSLLTMNGFSTGAMDSTRQGLISAVP